jgi:hypothetical protein
MESKEFFAINKESAIAKAQEWAKINNKFINKIAAGPEEEDKPTGWCKCTIEIIETPEGHLLEGVTLDNSINAV